MTPLPCPQCGSLSFEQRGDVRFYEEVLPSLTESGDLDLNEQGWKTPIDTLEMDTDDDGVEIIYCNGCDSEFTLAELANQ